LTCGFFTADIRRSPNFLTHKFFNPFSKMPVQCPFKIATVPSDHFPTIIFGVIGASFALHSAIGLECD